MNELEIKSEEQKSKKIITIILSFFWFVFSPMILYVNAIYGFFSNTILAETSGLMFLITYLILPVILIFSPIIYKLIFKKSFLNSLAISFISLIVYLVFLFLCLECLNFYLSDFSKTKWNNYPMNRYLMIENLEEKHKIIGLTTEEIIDLLGDPEIVIFKKDVINKEINKFEYPIEAGFFSTTVYSVEFEDNIVVRINRFSY